MLVPSFLNKLFLSYFCCVPEAKGERGGARAMRRLRFGLDSKPMFRQLLGKVHRAVFERPVPSGRGPGAPLPSGGFRAEARSAQAVSSLNPCPCGLLHSTLQGPDLFSFGSREAAMKYAIKA